MHNAAQYRMHSRDQRSRIAHSRDQWSRFVHSRDQWSRWPRALVLALSAILVTLAACPAARAQEIEVLLPDKEAQVKCALLYSFSLLTTWPTEAFADDKSPFVIGVLGERPHLHYLDRVAEAKKEIRGRKLVIERYRTVDQIAACQVLFVAGTVPIDVEQAAIKRVAGRSLLVVGERPLAGSAAPTHIHFLIQNQRVKFLVDVAAAKARQLQIDPRLLTLASSAPGGVQP